MIGDWLSNPQLTQIIGCYTAINKNEEAFYERMGNYFQDKVSEAGKAGCREAHTLKSGVLLSKEGGKCLCVYAQDSSERI